MNYNSVEEILSSGISNMTVLRNNLKNDDGTDDIAGVDWFTFNNTTISTLQANGNSYIAFGPSYRLNVNSRDGAMYYLYREEGILDNQIRFLKIRWSGYSNWNSTDPNYALSYDVILWETGDISLHMISIPADYNTGSYSLEIGFIYSYTVSASNPDITFKKNDSGFEFINELIKFDLFKKRYLIKSDSTYYTVANETLTKIEVSEITSELFLNHGAIEVPAISMLTNLSNPEILYWTEGGVPPEKGLVINITPTLPKIIYYDTCVISDDSKIVRMQADASKDALFAITFDNGLTWKYYSNSSWQIANSLLEGMTTSILEKIPKEALEEIPAYTSYRIRCSLPTTTSYVGKVAIGYSS